MTIVGHPEGRLKKWAAGTVVDAYGDWFTSTAYILPGDSGSPVLDDAGTIVGIIHRGPTAQDLFTSGGANEYSIGTASAPLGVARDAGLPAVMLSTAAAVSAADAVDNNLVYLNGRASTVSVEGTPTSVLTLLGQACDTALARTDYTSPDDLTAALVPCERATLWIECRSDATAPAYGVVCPIGDDAQSWRARYQAVNRLWVAMNGNTELSPLSFGVAALAINEDYGRAAGAQSLVDALIAVDNPALDFGLLNFLAAFDVETYGGVDTVDWLRHYADRPGWQLFASSITSAFLWYRSLGVVSAADTDALLSRLAGDPGVGLGAKLYIDEAMYHRGH